MHGVFLSLWLHAKQYTQSVKFYEARQRTTTTKQPSNYQSLPMAERHMRFKQPEQKDLVEHLWNE